MLRTALVFLALAGVAHADPQQEAGEHFAKGEKAQAANRFQDAIDEYQQAFQLLPHPNALFNIAVCYEKLSEWANAADYYQRYLSFGDEAPPDADAIKDKVRVLKEKAAPDPKTTPYPHPEEPKETPPVGTTFTRWHGGLSYGVGVGDTAVERYLARGGLRLADRIEFDGVFGRFGKNDLALGAVGNLVLMRGPVEPYLHGAATIGYAKQDHSSSAGTKLPLGFEAGGGVRFGGRARFELQALLRFTEGGWDETSTVVDSYVNDAVAFAIDLGFSFDIPASLGPR